MERYTSRTLFEELNGSEYQSYSDLEAKVLELYAENFRDFPPHYGVRDLLELGEERGWIVEEGSKYVIRFESSPTTKLHSPPAPA